jgi:coenzyme F420-reducing hydrogenase alpha subunit
LSLSDSDTKEDAIDTKRIDGGTADMKEGKSIHALRRAVGGGEAWSKQLREWMNSKAENMHRAADHRTIQGFSFESGNDIDI